MAKKEFWIIVVVVVGFLGFMLGYAVPPFVEVGLSHSKAVSAGEEESISPEEQEIMKQYQKMLQEEGEGE